MIEKRIAFKSLDDKADFVKVARKLDCDVDIRSGSKCVDGKSELGVLAFNGEIGRMKVRVHSNKDSDLNMFKKWFI